MSSIRDIVFVDIISFLWNNDIIIPKEKDEAYDIALELILYNNDIVYTDVIIDWMKAYNLLLNKVYVPNYSINQINELSDKKLNNLIALLDTDGIDSVINILLFMHKIISLDKDSIFEVMKNSNISTIENMCLASTKINNFCQTLDVKTLVISKIAKDSLDINDFSLKELFIYSKVVPLKKKIYGAINDNILVNTDDKITFADSNGYDYKISFRSEESSQIVPTVGGRLIVLNNDGTIFFYNDKNGKSNYLRNHPYERFIKIEPDNFLTRSGKLYRPYLGFSSDITIEQIYLGPENTIQYHYPLALTSKGEVYYINSYIKEHEGYKMEDLPEIVQITPHGYLLSVEGDVYKYKYSIGDRFYFKTNLSKVPINNISQITTSLSSDQILAVYLDVNGDIFIHKHNEDPSILLPKTLNVIEILLVNKRLWAIDNNHKLYDLYIN